jgi:hypothetical protein
MRMPGPRHAIAAVATIALLAGGAGAQQTAPPHEPIIVGGAGAPQGHESCVEVEIGGERSYSCLNQQMKRDVNRTNPVPNIAPLDAHSPDPRIGIVNIPAVQQQYGKNFGVSVFPYRPPPPNFPGARR